MMSPDNKIPGNRVSDNNPSSGGRKSAGDLRPPEQGLNCPRCDSPNTKFCYYNNYNLSQPRHFCKTCRRYWTSGGALRNVPVGGGCRKNKKIKSSSRLSCDSKDSPLSWPPETSTLKYFPGVSPSMELQLGGLPFSRSNLSTASNLYNQFPCAIATTSPTCFDLDPSASSSSLMGFNYLSTSNIKQGDAGGFNGGFQQMSSMGFSSNLASSIESLSVINQDLHRRLQQERLAEMLSEDNQQKETSVSSIPAPIFESQLQKTEAILFQNLEISKPDASAVACNNITTEWFFENSSGTPNMATTNSINSGEDNTSSWSGLQTWSELHQYGSLP